VTEEKVRRVTWEYIIIYKGDLRRCGVHEASEWCVCERAAARLNRRTHAQ